MCHWKHAVENIQHQGFTRNTLHRYSCQSFVCLSSNYLAESLKEKLANSKRIVGSTSSKNSPKRGMRSSPDTDPDLGWPWKSYRRECLIDLNKYHYLVCGCIVFHCGRTDGRTYSRRDIFTGFIRSSQELTWYHDQHTGGLVFVTGWILSTVFTDWNEMKWRSVRVWITVLLVFGMLLMFYCMYEVGRGFIMPDYGVGSGDGHVSASQYGDRWRLAPNIFF